MKENDNKINQIIIHVDMDAFFASVEIRDNIDLVGKPLIIGSLPHERGVVSTCSYEARKYGVHSGMNIKEAYRLCPNGIYMHPNYHKYVKISERLHKIWGMYASKAEYIALDEGYLDVTKIAKDFDGARKIAQAIKRLTYLELGLTCSVGLAYSKTSAKTASEEKKPNGYFEILSKEDFVNLMIDRDVNELYTVGKKTAEKLHQHGIYKIRDIHDKKEEVISLLGKQGKWIVDLSYGIDDREVEPYLPENAKSISRELTFQQDVTNFNLLDDVLFLLSLCVEDRAKYYNLKGKGVTLKITYGNMKSITRSKPVKLTNSSGLIYLTASTLLHQIEPHPIRLIGVGIHNINSEEVQQLNLLELDNDEADYQDIIDKKIKELENRYHLDYKNHINDILHGETLYKTSEYMRKYIIKNT